MFVWRCGRSRAEKVPLQSMTMVRITEPELSQTGSFCQSMLDGKAPASIRSKKMDIFVIDTQKVKQTNARCLRW